MTRPDGTQPPAAEIDLSGILFTDNQNAIMPHEEVRNLAREAASSGEAENQESELQKSLETRAVTIRSEVLNGVHKDEAESSQADEEAGVVHHERHRGECPVLIPGLPVELASNILSRVPWKDQPKLMTVCKTWAACMMSDSVYSIRSREGMLESFLFTISVPLRIGPLRLTLFDVRGCPLDSDTPLVSFNFLGRWSGFLRGFRCAVIGPDLFIAGGRHDGLRYATGKNVWRFNFISRKWSEVASMNHARRDFACAVINGRIYVAGGTCSSQVVPRGQGVATAMDSAEMYDYKNDKWHELPRLHTARVGCLGVARQGRFYVIGGGSDHGTVRFSMFRSAEVFDPHTNEWQTIHDMWQSGVQLPRAVAGYESSLFAIDCDDHKLVSYDENANAWRDVMDIPSSAITDLPGKLRNGQAERHQAMGGLPGDHLVQIPCEGLLWVGPCGFLSRAASLFKLAGSEGRGWMGTVGTEACPEERAIALERKVRRNSRSHLIIAAGVVSV